MPGVRADAAVFDGRHIATLNGTPRVSSTGLRTDNGLDVSELDDPSCC